MIDTREQYEAILRSQETEGHFDARVNDALETIEALREVAKAASYYQQEKRKFLLGLHDYDRDGGKPLDDALSALPAWLKEDD